MVKIIINPYSAKGLAVWPATKKRIDDCGVEYDFAIAGEKRPGDLARQAREEGAEKVFVVGGDGTINEVINGLGLKGIALGIIPAGCGNDFAKMLGVKSVEDGISSMLGGDRKSVDVGFANNRYFINNLGIGVNAHAVRIYNRLRKITGRGGYVVPGLLALLGFRAFGVEVESRDLRFSGKVLGISAGNGSSQGGVFCFTPGALIDDGLLDVCVIRKMGRIKRLFSVCKAVKGRHIFLKEAEIFRTDVFSIHSNTPFCVNLDGELGERPLNKLEVKVLSRQLQFCVPTKPS
ncbi:MAG: diacylglycerol/lipid kinase family protein [Planctomycetota bacterium]